jgi:fluoride ion exporter CrcB/FEX
MALFAMVGAVIGGLARWIVEDAVNSRLAAELAAREGGQTPPPAGGTRS